MAQQLIGVTMQEKGVSRIVAVDLAAAEKMATETV
jgi:chromosome segregation protein